MIRKIKANFTTSAPQSLAPTNGDNNFQIEEDRERLKTLLQHEKMSRERRERELAWKMKESAVSCLIFFLLNKIFKFFFYSCIIDN